ncbi:hypothetical protein H6P81_016693 [Aristolochia fimbriata]|uniref:PROP1-like PPR domain-containing protein n=1 Tax=Aristolochia fimbriata TaxID=158543 RepID=A0AAV7EDN3_ARIFI|nr:hypothetical protein H6P81_016693 [Aristolochia fimbriata]
MAGDQSPQTPVTVKPYSKYCRTSGLAGRGRRERSIFKQVGDFRKDTFVLQITVVPLLSHVALIYERSTHPKKTPIWTTVASGSSRRSWPLALRRRRRRRPPELQIMIGLCPFSVGNLTTSVSKRHCRPSSRPLSNLPRVYHFPNSSVLQPVLALGEELKPGEGKEGEERPKLRWPKLEPSLTDEQKLAISRLPRKMTKRCRALMERLICLSLQGEELAHLLFLWVKIMKPRRADWLSVLKEMDKMGSPLFLEVMELALLEESFEANVRDYTKLIHKYSKQSRLKDAENAISAMERRGFSCDQVTLTVLLDMYSKAGNLNRAEEIFEDIKLLGLPVDKRAYGSMIMAYIRAGMHEKGENLKTEMEAEDVYAGKEVYKAMLRAYSISGDTERAQRIFDSIQLAGTVPDAKLSALLINAYCAAGQSDKAQSVLENLRNARLEPSDKCVALLLAAYEKDNNLDKALSLLLDLEKDGFNVGEEAAQILAKWLRKLGVLNEIETVLRDFSEYEMPAL